MIITNINIVIKIDQLFLSMSSLLLSGENHILPKPPSFLLSQDRNNTSKAKQTIRVKTLITSHEVISYLQELQLIKILNHKVL